MSQFEEYQSALARFLQERGVAPTAQQSAADYVASLQPQQPSTLQQAGDIATKLIAKKGLESLIASEGAPLVSSAAELAAFNAPAMAATAGAEIAGANALTQGAWNAGALGAESGSIMAGELGSQAAANTAPVTASWLGPAVAAAAFLYGAGSSIHGKDKTHARPIDDEDRTYLRDYMRKTLGSTADDAALTNVINKADALGALSHGRRTDKGQRLPDLPGFQLADFGTQQQRAQKAHWDDDSWKAGDSIYKGSAQSRLLDYLSAYKPDKVAGYLERIGGDPRATAFQSDPITSTLGAQRAYDNPKMTEYYALMSSILGGGDAE